MLWKRRKICAGTTDYAVTLNDSINGIYLSRSSLDAAFDDDGRQINPLIGGRLENGKYPTLSLFFELA